ncbi:MAG: hypothetical protein MPW14_03615 [Candidatus Manganitrophus sp.]|nr:hypothetical protein [Candidatus Manganitrophus sp.]MDC4227118.1 hypothetical protein [Candidatus Manganitrophus sp.]WDT71747.1 MAG: hypothetical protein MPW17_02570 [Candidatus Manganitrophus sp.]WDT80882.1 MAG: hypothetical protein MPW14_03615 [Candidatus Manganitrophus sp.]
MPSNKKVAKQKRTTHPKGNPAQNPRKLKRADNVYRKRAKPMTSDLTERFDHRSPTRVHQIPDLPAKGQRGAPRRGGANRPA